MEDQPEGAVVSDDFTDDDLQGTATPPEPADEETTGGAAETPPEEKQPEYVQVTKSDFDKLMANAARIDEINATVVKQRDDAFGRIGRLEAALNEMRQSSQNGTVSDEDLAELAQEYPDLAGLSVFKKLRAAGGIDPDAVGRIVQERVESANASAREQTRREFETRLLTRDHPDWRQVVGVPAKAGDPIPDTEYRRWLAAQPEEYRAEVGSVWDADVVGASIKKFKESAKAKAAPNPAADQRRSRLAAAVPAKGDADPASPAEPDPFEAGYQSG
jgi:hypothetical protein